MDPLSANMNITYGQGSRQSMNLRETVRLAFAKMLDEQYDYEWQRNGPFTQSSRTLFQAQKVTPNHTEIIGKVNGQKRRLKKEQSTLNILL